MNPLEQMMGAKVARDVVRDNLIRELRALPGLSPDVQALLTADTRATEALSLAVDTYNLETPQSGTLTP